MAEIDNLKALQEILNAHPAGSNSAFHRYIKPSVERKKISKKKPMLVQPSKKEIGNLIDKCLSPLDEPIKGRKRVEKPVNMFDYLNALVRIPEIQEDLEAIRKEPTKEKELVCNKYFGIPGFSSKVLQNPEVFYKYNKYYHCSNAIHVFSNSEKDDPNFTSEYRDGRHLILAVDITRKNPKIINDLEKLLKRIEKDYDIPKDTSRDKDTIVDIWKIYDYKTKDGLSLPEIARRLSGEKGNSAYCEALDMYVKRVKRAYHKAKEIINTVKREVEEAIIANAKKKEDDNKFKEMLNRMVAESGKKERIITIRERLLQGIPKKTKRK